MLPPPTPPLGPAAALMTGVVAGEKDRGMEAGGTGARAGAGALGALALAAANKWLGVRSFIEGAAVADRGGDDVEAVVDAADVDAKDAAEARAEKGADEDAVERAGAPEGADAARERGARTIMGMGG